PCTGTSPAAASPLRIQRSAFGERARSDPPTPRAHGGEHLRSRRRRCPAHLLGEPPPRGPAISAKPGPHSLLFRNKIRWPDCSDSRVRRRARALGLLAREAPTVSLLTPAPGL